MPEFPSTGEVEIPDGELLYRRIYPDPGHLVPLEDGTGYRPRSGALRSPEPLSVDRSSLSTPEETRDRDTYRAFHVAAIAAGVARSCGCGVRPDPDEGNPAHALITGAHRDGKGGLSNGQAEKLARRSKIILLNATSSATDI